VKALVVGGGIGGLSAGIALARAGTAVEVFERAPEIREVGAGISLWPNAVRVLDALGVGAALRAQGTLQMEGAVRDPRGRVLLAVSLRDLERESGGPTILLHRGTLVGILRDALLSLSGRASLRLAAQFVGLEQRGRRVVARFADGSVAEGDLLVGADGLRSAVRAATFPAARPVYAGYTCLRGLARLESPVDLCGETWGPGARFGFVPLGDGRWYWWATWNAPEGEPLEPEQRKRAALDAFRGWHAPIEELIQRTDPDAILHDDLRELAHLPWWVRGRVALLGDAAHAMTPNLGQGACQAIEDAAVLSRCLATGAPVEDALDLYVRLRRPRALAAQRDSRSFGTFGQLASPLLCHIRDALTRATRGRWGRSVILKYTAHGTRC
jgi:2-polyprenyl-6-methoxyphenol hydroxylase-like FAD-dependent oxidoreductase